MTNLHQNALVIVLDLVWRNRIGLYLGPTTYQGLTAHKVMLDESLTIAVFELDVFAPANLHRALNKKLRGER